MSLFHVLKYPVSDPPTMEELAALPHPILQQWAEFVYENNSRAWYTTELGTGVLRHMIQGYEDPDEPV